MSVELIKKSLVLNHGIKKENAQIIKEKDLIVPDGKPDMQKVLQMDGKLEIDQMEVQQDRITYKGKTELTILYLPENNPMSICTMKGTLPLEDFIVMEGVDSNHKVKLNYSMRHLHWNVLNERKLNVKVIIQLEANAIDNQTAEVAIDFESSQPIQVKKQAIYFLNKGPIKEEKMILKDDLTVPTGKANIGEVLRTDIQISDKEIRRTEEEIFYSGNLNISTLYKVENDDEVIEMMFHKIPFNSAVEYVREDEEEFYDCDLSIAQQYVQVIPDLDGEDRILEAEIVMRVEASTIGAVTEEIIGDIYCPGKDVEITDQSNDFINLLHKVDTCLPKKETVMFEEMAPDNEAIYSICMTPIIEEKIIKGDSLEIKGFVEVKTIYTTQEATEKLATTNTVIPFSQTIEIEGIDSSSVVMVTSNIEDISLLTQGKREAVVEFKICNKIEVYKKQPLYMLEDIDLTDIDIEDLKKLPSMVVYTVKKGDSYWSIAKKYNTTVEEIAQLNEVDVNETIYPGQKIMILKRVNY